MNCNKGFSKVCNRIYTLWVVKKIFLRIVEKAFSKNCKNEKKNNEMIKNALHKMMQHYIIHYMSQTAMRPRAIFRLV